MGLSVAPLILAGTLYGASLHAATEVQDISGALRVLTEELRATHRMLPAPVPSPGP